MPLVIPDDVLEQLHLTEQEARVEFACRLFDAGKLSKAAAGRLAGLSRVELEDALVERGLPWVRLDTGYWEVEQESLRKLGQLREQGDARRK